MDLLIRLYFQPWWKKMQITAIHYYHVWGTKKFRWINKLTVIEDQVWRCWMNNKKCQLITSISVDFCFFFVLLAYLFWRVREKLSLTWEFNFTNFWIVNFNANKAMGLEWLLLAVCCLFFCATCVGPHELNWIQTKLFANFLHIPFWAIPSNQEKLVRLSGSIDCRIFAWNWLNTCEKFTICFRKIEIKILHWTNFFASFFKFKNQKTV